MYTILRFQVLPDPAPAVEVNKKGVANPKHFARHALRSRQPLGCQPEDKQNVNKADSKKLGQPSLDHATSLDGALGGRHWSIAGRSQN